MNAWVFLQIGVKYDPSVNLGQILTVLSLLIVLLGAYQRMMSRIAIIESRVEDLWENFINNRHRPGGL